MMAAGLQGHIRRGARRGFPAVGQSLPLGVELAALFVPALADDAPVLDDDRTHQRVGTGPACTALCQVNGPAHIVLIVHGSSPLPKEKTL